MSLRNSRDDVETGIKIAIDEVIEGRRTSKDSGGRDLNVDAFILNIPDVKSPSVMKTIAPTNSSTSSYLSAP
ncbi:hypothetical protein FRC18_003015 [Serendipita sp. 400]|nr:hypothetical protein FRC18_003015 [Serendipita sp. 400]